MTARAQVLTHGHLEVPWSRYPAFHAAVAACSFAARCLAEVLQHAITLDEVGTDRCEAADRRADPFGPRVTFRSALLWTAGDGETLVLDWVVLGRDQATAMLCQVAAGSERRGDPAHAGAALRFFEPGRGWEDRDPISGRVLRR